MLTRLTEPTVDPVPLAEMKAHLAVEDTLRDELISAYTAAAVSYVEQHCNLALAQAEYAVRLDAETRLPLVIPVWPVASVDAIAFEGESPETAVDAAAYALLPWRPSRLVGSAAAWPSAPDGAADHRHGRMAGRREQSGSMDRARIPEAGAEADRRALVRAPRDGGHRDDHGRSAIRREGAARSAEDLPLMRAGALDRRITIERPAEVQDAAGQPVPGWDLVAERWAQKRDVRGRERFAAEQTIGEETAVFVIRWLAGIDATMRVVHDGKVYDIQGLAEIGTRDGLEITATAQGV